MSTELQAVLELVEKVPQGPWRATPSFGELGAKFQNIDVMDGDKINVSVGYLTLPGAEDFGPLIAGAVNFLRSDEFKRLREDAQKWREAEAAGMVPAPHFRGYAYLGIGGYVLFHSCTDDEPELCIVPATDEEKAGRTVGDLRYDGPDEIPAERMAVRLRFKNVAGLDALEQQLGLLRQDHFPDAARTPEIAR